MKKKLERRQRLRLRKRAVADLSPGSLSDVAGGNGQTDYDYICTDPPTQRCVNECVSGRPDCPIDTCERSCGGTCGATVCHHTCDDTCPANCEPTYNNLNC